MATIAELESCDGFAVESPAGLLGWVEETWLDGEGRPGALAVRTSAGGRALLLTQDVGAVDADTQEVLLRADARLHELDAPRLERVDGRIAASWQTTGAEIEPAAAPIAAEDETAAPAVAAARAATAHAERSLPLIVALAFCVLAAIVAFQISLAFLVAYLVTGRAY